MFDLLLVAGLPPDLAALVQLDYEPSYGSNVVFHTAELLFASPRSGASILPLPTCSHSRAFVRGTEHASNSLHPDSLCRGTPSINCCDAVS
jgi:hypothetical protein